MSRRESDLSFTGFNGQYNGQAARAKTVMAPTDEEARQHDIRKRIELLAEQKLFREEIDFL